MKKDTLKMETSEIKRDFKYAKGNTQLNFTLRIDIKQELKDFKECLEQAVKDVADQISKI